MNKVSEASHYTFTQDVETGTTVASGFYDPTPGERSLTLQREAGGTLRGPTHQGGHLVPARANGPAIPETHFAQERDLNISSVKKLENAEYRSAVDPDVVSLYTERTAFISNQRTPTGEVPDAFLFNDTITFENGRVLDTHFSFENLPNSQQESLQEEVAQFDIPDTPNPGDGLRESMDPLEYAELMEETELEFSIKDELDDAWTQIDFSEETSAFSPSDPTADDLEPVEAEATASEADLSL